MSITRYVLEQQQKDLWEDKKREYLKTNSIGFLHKKKKKHEKTAFDDFKKMNFSVKDGGEDVPDDLDGLNIWETIQKCTLRGLNHLYDVIYPLYLSGSISPEQWHAFENLAEHRNFSAPNNSS